jgi:hypothetical protein
MDRHHKGEFMTVFVNGRQKHVRRPPTIDGMDPEEFIRANADPIFLHQEGRWDIIEERTREEKEMERGGALKEKGKRSAPVRDDDFDIPF